jgi:hypothetical protein
MNGINEGDEFDGADKDISELDGVDEGGGEVESADEGGRKVDGANEGDGEFDGAEGSGEVDSANEGDGEFDGAEGSGEVDGADKSDNELNGANKGGSVLNCVDEGDDEFDDGDSGELDGTDESGELDGGNEGGEFGSAYESGGDQRSKSKRFCFRVFPELESISLEEIDQLLSSQMEREKLYFLVMRRALLTQTTVKRKVYFKTLIF